MLQRFARQNRCIVSNSDGGGGGCIVLDRISSGAGAASAALCGHGDALLGRGCHVPLGTEARPTMQVAAGALVFENYSYLGGSSHLRLQASQSEAHVHKRLFTR
jgi:hypothetical protein